MNKCTKWFIAFLAVSIVAIWAVLAFCIDESLVSRFSLWSSLIVGTATSITSFLALYISVLTFKRNEDAKKQKREEEARLFIHDNNDEIDYLPYCTYASCYDRHGHHTRKIYNEFCRLPDEIQAEVLKQANYKLPLLSDSDWIYERIKIIERFAKQYGFGDTFLYDSGKNFLNGYKTKEEPYIEEHEEELRDVFGMYNIYTRLFNRKGITIDQYFEGYGYRKFRDPDWLETHEYLEPCELLIELKELRNPEKTSNGVVAFWMCHLIENIYFVIEEYFYGKTPDGIIQNDSQPEYFEDKFYEILNILYCLDDYSKYSLIEKEPYDKNAKIKL